MQFKPTGTIASNMVQRQEEEEELQRQRQRQRRPVSVVSPNDEDEDEDYDRENLESVCCNAEGYFLKQQYQKAFSVCMGYFCRHNQNKELLLSPSTPSSSKTPKTTLSNPLKILGKKYSISISHHHQQQSEEKKTTTMMMMKTSSLMAVALQSWYEIDKIDQRNHQQQQQHGDIKPTNMNWKHLQPLLEYIQQHSIPSMEFFVIWIYFWEQQRPQYKTVAVDWTLQVLFQTKTLVLYGDGEEEFYQELWIHCLTEQLPKLSCAPSTLTALVSSLLNSKQDDAAINGIVRINEEMLTNAPKAKHVSILLEFLRTAWQESHDSKHSEWIAKAIQRLHEKQQQLQEQESSKGAVSTVERAGYGTAASTLLQPSSSSSTTTMQGLNGYSYYDSMRSWIHGQCQRLLRMTANDQSKEDHLLSRGRIGISIFFVLLTIRYRLRISKTIKAILVALLAPVTELIQAIGALEEEKGGPGSTSSTTRSSTRPTKSKP
jgi:hypothetical protein